MMSKLSKHSIDQILAKHDTVATDGIFILDQSWTKTIIECTSMGLSVITPNLFMSAHLILQTIAGLNRSIIITTREIWRHMEAAFEEHSTRLQTISIVLI